jgi:hypothetical protein
MMAAKTLLGADAARAGLSVGASGDEMGGAKLHLWRWEGDPERIVPFGEELHLSARLLLACETNAARLVVPIENWARSVRSLLKSEGHAKLASAEIQLDSAMNTWRAAKKRVDRSYE